jgi:hypothetical protein
MRIHKVYIVVGLALAFALFFEIAAHASELDQKTYITFDVPVQVPGRVLPAGGYIFEELADNPNLVRILNANGSEVETTFDTVPAIRAQTADHTVIRVAADPSQPDYLVDWFYPGTNTGHEFIYPHRQEQKIAATGKTDVAAKQPHNLMSDNKRPVSIHTSSFCWLRMWCAPNEGWANDDLL